MKKQNTKLNIVSNYHLKKKQKSLEKLLSKDQKYTKRLKEEILLNENEWKELQNELDNYSYDVPLQQDNDDTVDLRELEKGIQTDFDEYDPFISHFESTENNSFNQLSNIITRNDTIELSMSRIYNIIDETDKQEGINENEQNEMYNEIEKENKELKKPKISQIEEEKEGTREKRKENKENTEQKKKTKSTKRKGITTRKMAREEETKKTTNKQEMTKKKEKTKKPRRGKKDKEEIKNDETTNTRKQRKKIAKVTRKGNYNERLKRFHKEQLKKGDQEE